MYISILLFSQVAVRVRPISVPEVDNGQSEIINTVEDNVSYIL